MSKSQAISETEIKKRKIFLIETIGLSKDCVASMQKTTNALCDPWKAQRRVTNLEKLGFHSPIDLIESNPTLINRKDSTVSKRFKLVQTWMCRFSRKINVHKLFDRRPQLWSVGKDKLAVIFLLAVEISGGVTPERICNLITLNLEDLLITYMHNSYADCVDIHRLTRECSFDVLFKNYTKEKKRKIIAEGSDRLPKAVYAEYHLRFLM